MAIVTPQQAARVNQMVEHSYQIISLRFDSHSGHVTVGVKLSGGATRYFFINRKGKLLENE